MKQHITIEQLNELTDKGRERLREWWKPKTLGELFYDPEHGYVAWNPSTPMKMRIAEVEPLPILSIGQMIEFLESQLEFGRIIELTRDVNNPAWFVEICELDGADRFEGGVIFHEPELCDTLWEAVKEVLEK